MQYIRWHLILNGLARVLCIVALAVSGVSFAAEDAGEIVYLRAEVERDENGDNTVFLYQNGAAPSVLVLFMSFDSSLLDIVPSGSGEYATLAVAREASGVTISSVYHSAVDDVPGKACLAVAVYRTDVPGTLQPGALFSFSLRTTSAAAASSSFRISMGTTVEPVLINGKTFASSAAGSDERPLEVVLEDVAVPGNCIPPNPPKKVSASWRYRDRIVVRWEPPDTEHHLEYRVYRGECVDVFQAIPVGDGWISTTEFQDMLTDRLVDAPSAGCSCSATRYYYWVRSRDMDTQCESGFSDPPARGALASRWLSFLSCWKKAESSSQ